jgi:hypothetical protein
MLAEECLHGYFLLPAHIVASAKQKERALNSCGWLLKEGISLSYAVLGCLQVCQCSKTWLGEA